MGLSRRGQHLVQEVHGHILYTTECRILWQQYKLHQSRRIYVRFHRDGQILVFSVSEKGGDGGGGFFFFSG